MIQGAVGALPPDGVLLFRRTHTIAYLAHFAIDTPLRMAHNLHPRAEHMVGATAKQGAMAYGWKPMHEICSFTSSES